jgi:hypothetical protein
MDTNMSLFNQINSLCYWFRLETNYHCLINLDSEKDSYVIKLKEQQHTIYEQRIVRLSKKTEKLLQIELGSIANSLVHIKKNYFLEHQSA